MWYANPAISFWPGTVPAGETLCSKCYQLGYRQFKQGKKARVPAPDHQDVESGCKVPMPGTPKLSCEAIVNARTHNIGINNNNVATCDETTGVKASLGACPELMSVPVSQPKDNSSLIGPMDDGANFPCNSMNKIKTIVAAL